MATRQNLRRSVRAPSLGHGDSRGPHRPARALAEPLRRTGDRLNPPRVPGSFPHTERDTPPSARTGLHRLLQHRAATPSARQQQSPATRRGPAVSPARPRDPPCDRPCHVAVQARVLVGSFPMAIVTTAGRDASASHAPSPVRRRREKVGPIWFLTRTPGAPGNHSSRSSSHGAPEVEGGPEDGPVTLPSHRRWCQGNERLRFLESHPADLGGLGVERAGILDRSHQVVGRVAGRAF